MEKSETSRLPKPAGVCCLSTQLPNIAASPLKSWIQERQANTDAQVREFVGLVQLNLRQMGVPLDFGAREAEVKTIGH